MYSVNFLELHCTELTATLLNFFITNEYTHLFAIKIFCGYLKKYLIFVFYVTLFLNFHFRLSVHRIFYSVNPRMRHSKTWQYYLKLS